MHYAKYIIVLVATTLMAGELYAQSETQPDSPIDEEIMRPTKWGMRLTPAIARGLSKAMVADEVREEMYISDEQSAQLSDKIYRRIMKTGHKHGQKFQFLFEYFVEEKLGRGENGLTPATAKEFAERAKPTIPIMREFLIGYGQDARSVLNSKQFKTFQKKHKEMLKGTRELENKINRWADGQFKEGEKLDQVDPQDKIDNDPENSENPKKESPEQKKYRRKLWHARSLADRNLHNIGPAQWADLLETNKQLFKFNEEQSTEGDLVLAEYTENAKIVMTDEWKRRLRRNLIKAHLIDSLNDLTSAPWSYHLQQEYDQQIKPINEMGKAFEQDILALVTEDQWTKVSNRMQEFAAKHGMTFDQQDRELLALRPKQQDNE